MKVFIIFSICIATAMPRRHLTLEDRSLLEDESDKSLIGGRSAKESLDEKYFEFPWMVSLHYQGRFICSSFLVTPKFLMTAAHCVAFKGVKDPKDFNAYMGTVERDGPDNKVTFTEVIVPEEYVNDKDYDIAIMKLEKPVELRYNIQTICLPTKDSVYENTSAQAMGWGFDKKGVHGASNTMQTSTEKVLENSMCNSTYNAIYRDFFTEKNYEKFLTPRHICAGGDIDKGICSGDSGGPLVAMIDTKPVTIGVASLSSKRGCAEFGIPAVYTATAMYTDWIVEHMGEDANDLCFVDKTSTPTRR